MQDEEVEYSQLPVSVISLLDILVKSIWKLLQMHLLVISVSYFL